MWMLLGAMIAGAAPATISDCAVVTDEGERPCDDETLEASGEHVHFVLTVDQPHSGSVLLHTLVKQRGRSKGMVRVESYPEGRPQDVAYSVGNFTHRPTTYVHRHTLYPHVLRMHVIVTAEWDGDSRLRLPSIEMYPYPAS